MQQAKIVDFPVQGQTANGNGALALIRLAREALIQPLLRKTLVLILASYADPDGGSIYPSLKTLALLTGRDIRNVRRQIRGLEADGLLVQTKPASRTQGAEFRLVIDALDALKPGTTARLRGPETGHWCTETGHWCPPTCLTCLT